MAKIDWNVIEERIAKGETTKEEAIKELTEILNLNISHYESLIMTAKESPEVYPNMESYQKTLGECYQAFADLRRGIRISEIPL